jgi:hypothetical protein
MQFCQCDSGYVGDDCSSKVPATALPTALVPQYADDQYGEDHPVFHPMYAIAAELSSKSINLKSLKLR